jgi:predicted enzyme related to lactoylglutathione lyase
MSLWSAKILYLFLDTTSISRQRTFVETILGLEVIENEYHPPHNRHGVVKYDAGEVILALNVADPDFDQGATGALVTVLEAQPLREAQIYAELQINGYVAPPTSGGIFADGDNHKYAVRRAAPAFGWTQEETRPSIVELQLAVDDLGESKAFYGGLLDLIPLEETEQSAAYATGNLRLVLRDWRAVSNHPPRRHKGCLIVFHAEDVAKTYSALADRGVGFQGGVGHSEIGAAARFHDPSGNVLCLYQPSPESLSWRSGPKVSEIISSESARSPWGAASDLRN